MSEHDFEPIRGLPATPPKDERILWQGAPDWWALSQRAFHVRSVSAYFLALMIWRGVALGSMQAGVQLLPLALICIGLLVGLAALTARTTVYTITSKRVVMRFGLALPKAINIPFAIIASADLRTYGDKSGDVSLSLAPPNTINYFLLWPHARPWKLARAQPTLRALPDGAGVGALLAGALRGTPAATSVSQVQEDRVLSPTPELTPA
jgi:hypothetical protein